MNLDKLDKVFSIYIRRRDADENGQVKCCTCPAVAHWKQMDAGHFMPRGNLSVRYDEKNSHPQCRLCNGTLCGKPSEYSKFIIDQYGPEELERLLTLRHQTVGLMQYEIDGLERKFKAKLKLL